MNELTTEISKKAQSLYYALRLNRLSAKERKLQKHGVVDGQGYLTALGIRIYLDYLWQQDKAAQTTIAKDLDAIKKADLKDEKDED